MARVVRWEVGKILTLKASLATHLTSPTTFVMLPTLLLSACGSLLKFLTRKSGCLNPTQHHSTAAQPLLKQLP